MYVYKKLGNFNQIYYIWLLNKNKLTEVDKTRK